MLKRHILCCIPMSTGYGTTVYDVKFSGIWTDEELINAVDNKAYHNPEPDQLICNNYGGYVERIYEKDNLVRARVGVYYD